MLNYEPRDVVNQCLQDTIFKPYTPNDLRKAYNFPSWAVGEGQNIAIISAYANPELLESVKIYNERFNLPPLDIEIAYPQGEPTGILINWAIETIQSVELIHALAPKSHILLVLAKTNKPSNLYEAVSYAVAKGCTIISMGWGSVESEEQLEVDKIFNVPGVAFVAASAAFTIIDYYKPIYPSSSPYVLAVGGTSLLLNNYGERIQDELAWNKSGGGISQYEPRQYWQNMQPYGIPFTNNRMLPDVAFVGDTFPGVLIYAQIPNYSMSGWMSIGGTSIGASCWAAILASIKTKDNKLYDYLPKLYALAGGTCYTNPYYAYNDIVKGNNGSFAATTGYDCVTGLGSPNVCNILDYYKELVLC